MSTYHALVIVKTSYNDYIGIGASFERGKQQGLWAGRWPDVLKTMDHVPEHLRRPHWLFLINIPSGSTRVALKRRFRPALCPCWDESFLMSDERVGLMPDEVWMAGANRIPDRPAWRLGWRAWLTALKTIQKRHKEELDATAITAYDLLNDE